MYVWINPSNTADSHLFPSMTQTFKLATFAYAVFSEAIAKTHKQLRSTASINSLCQCFMILYFNIGQSSIPLCQQCHGSTYYHAASPFSWWLRLFPSRLCPSRSKMPEQCDILFSLSCWQNMYLLLHNTFVSSGPLKIH